MSVFCSRVFPLSLGVLLSVTSVSVAGERPPRGGRTAVLKTGLDWQSNEFINKSGVGAFGLNLGVGGFVSPSLAIMLRLSGTTVGYEETVGSYTRHHESSADVYAAGIQYWVNDLVNLEAGAGLGVINDGRVPRKSGWFGSYGGRDYGVGLILGAGFSFLHKGKNSVQVGIEYAPVFEKNNGNVHNVKVALGWQYIRGIKERSGLGQDVEPPPSRPEYYEPQVRRRNAERAMGARIRVKTPRAVKHFYGWREEGSPWITGTLVETELDLIRMQPEEGNYTVTLPRDSVFRMEESLGMVARTNIGILVGAVVGAGIGAGIAAIKDAPDRTYNGIITSAEFDYGLTGLIFGAGVGYLAARLFPVEKWKRVPRWDRTFSMRPRAVPLATGPTVGLAMSF